MRATSIAAATLAVLLAGGLALAQEAAPKPRGYLPAGALDTVRVLPPAPTADSPRDKADRATFLASRALKDSPRWALAQSDAVQTIPATLKDLSCATGVTLTPDNAPKLAALIAHAVPDIRAAVDAPKDHYGRKRPYLVDEGDICVAKTEDLAKAYDYPSGHTTWSWTIGLILAELVPDHATDILVRARAYGESRVVCGVHNASAIEAGRTNAAALVAALHGQAAFRADMDAARAELAGLRQNAAAPTGCAAEAALVAPTPY